MLAAMPKTYSSKNLKHIFKLLGYSILNTWCAAKKKKTWLPSRSYFISTTTMSITRKTFFRKQLKSLLSKNSFERQKRFIYEATFYSLTPLHQCCKWWSFYLAPCQKRILPKIWSTFLNFWGTQCWIHDVLQQLKTWLPCMNSFRWWLHYQSQETLEHHHWCR